MSNETSRIDKFSDWFWRVIARAERDRNKLTTLMESMGREEITRFDHQFVEAARALTDSQFIEQMGDVSEDDVRDVADWVVSQGKDYYTRVLNHPEQMPPEVPQGGGSSFSSVADNVFWNRFGAPIPPVDQ